MWHENKWQNMHFPALAKVPQIKVHESGCLHFGCHDDDDAAEFASADEDEDVDDAARFASAD